MPGEAVRVERAGRGQRGQVGPRAGVAPPAPRVVAQLLNEVTQLAAVSDDAAQVVAVAVADRVLAVPADEQGEQPLGTIKVAHLPHGVASLLLLIVLAVFDN